MEAPEIPFGGTLLDALDILCDAGMRVELNGIDRSTMSRSVVITYGRGPIYRREIRLPTGNDIIDDRDVMLIAQLRSSAAMVAEFVNRNKPAADAAIKAAQVPVELK